MKTYTADELRTILDEHRKWRKGDGGARANLTDANPAGANLAGANLTGANLTDAYLAGAYLTGANLAGANLTDAYLAGANLTDAYLRGANLRGANLTGAKTNDLPGLAKALGIIVIGDSAKKSKPPAEIIVKGATYVLKVPGDAS